jgi:hypothetical protein
MRDWPPVLPDYIPDNIYLSNLIEEAADAFNIAQDAYKEWDELREKVREHAPDECDFGDVLTYLLNRASEKKDARVA